jgi:hypothetical protein
MIGFPKKFVHDIGIQCTKTKTKMKFTLLSALFCGLVSVILQSLVVAGKWPYYTLVKETEATTTMRKTLSKVSLLVNNRARLLNRVTNSDLVVTEYSYERLAGILPSLNGKFKNINADDILKGIELQKTALACYALFCGILALIGGLIVRKVLIKTRNLKIVYVVVVLLASLGFIANLASMHFILGVNSNVFLRYYEAWGYTNTFDM